MPILRLKFKTTYDSGEIQQTERTSLANAGDGGATIYPLVQSQQIDARFGGTNPLRDGQQQTERRQHRGEIKGRREEWRTG
jgi:hypothetical protein